MRQPKIGLALGSGGARGFAHVGVLKVLEEENIPIDMLAGCSMGALVAGLYASGQSVENLIKLSTTFKRKYFFDVTVPKMGFIQGDRALQFLRLFTKDMHIEDLPIPLAIVATDLESGKQVIFRKGLVATAIRASISIPGIFVPHKVNGKLLVDGAVVDRVPVSILKDMGADIIIAVDVSHYRGETQIASIFDVIMQSFDIMQDELVRRSVLSADIMIAPDVGKFSGKSFTNIDEIIKIGEQDTKKIIPKLKNVIEHWKEKNNE